jgi:ribosomal protein S18 acetylase RimI-like enzyme
MLVERRMEAFRGFIASGQAENYVFDDGIIKAILTIGLCRDTDKPLSFELWGIYVEPFMKRQGIGVQMLEFCEQKAQEKGFREICLWVLEKNTSARAFYEKMGYKADGGTKYLELFNAMEIRYSKTICGRGFNESDI